MKHHKVKWGDFRKLTPFSNVYGYDRGIPIDRYYIEKFLKENRSHIRGSVLEIKDSGYTIKFGSDKVRLSDILDINPYNRQATIYADLRITNDLPKAKYECIIITQTLQCLDDLDVVVRNLKGMLKKGGVVLCTLPSVTRVDPDQGEKGDFWRFTTASARYIFEKHFARKKIQIKAYGNIFVEICFLAGIAVEEITKKELDYYDTSFPLLICVRAIK